jgi:hypothetical protein
VLFVMALLLVIGGRVGPPALVLLVQLGPAARDPGLHRPPERALGWQRGLAVVPVRALEQDSAAGYRQREQGQIALRTIGGAVRPQQ